MCKYYYVESSLVTPTVSSEYQSYQTILYGVLLFSDYFFIYQIRYPPPTVEFNRKSSMYLIIKQSSAIVPSSFAAATHGTMGELAKSVTYSNERWVFFTYKYFGYSCNEDARLCPYCLFLPLPEETILVYAYRVRYFSSANPLAPADRFT
jgi:hypothetical protein